MMKLLFTDAGLQRLDETVGAGLLCVFDFDGTLSPIVAQPKHAQIPIAVTHRLAELSGLVPVAIITGRSVADISNRLEFKPQFVIGNHGIEGIPGEDIDNYEQVCHLWEQQLIAGLKTGSLFEKGIVLENKRYSLSIHYRMVRDRAKAAWLLQQLIGEMSPPPRIIPGKCVFNLLPPGSANKGSAILKLVEASDGQKVIYVGDDVTDEDVFRIQQKNILSIRVGWTSDSAAEFYLNHRLDVLRLLDELLRRLRLQR